MPGTFQCYGATGQAPTTSFFGSVPDRLTMALPYYPHAGGGWNLDQMVAADYVNKWKIFNTIFTNDSGGAGRGSQVTVSLGDFITAPDGTTNTMQKIVETASNNEHCLTAGWESVINGGLYKVRNAVIAKAAERTRIKLTVGDSNLGAAIPGTGVKVIYDLAGGQIGIGPTVFGGGSAGTSKGTWNVAAANTVASIIPLGGGVYICQMDVPVGSQVGGSPIQFIGFYLDSGSGTGAESTTYLGDGTSGVYAWKSSLLPPGAWRLNNRVFFDDFTDPTMANIDRNNTRAPNFDWYVHGQWNAFSAPAPTPANKFTQSGSSLTIGTQAADQIAMMGAASLGAPPGIIGGIVYGRGDRGPNADNAYVGKRVFRPPMLVESRHAWQFNITSANHISWWTTNLERLYNIPYNAGAPIPAGAELFTCENDWGEAQVAGGGPAHHLFTISAEMQTTLGVFSGYPIWYSTASYSPSVVVAYLGQLYQSQTFNTNQVPAGNPTNWLAFNDNTAFPNLGFPLTPYIVDLTQLNTFQVLWLPASLVDNDMGQMVQFFNGMAITRGAFVQPNRGHMAWGPNGAANNSVVGSPVPDITQATMGDNGTYPVIYQSGINGTLTIDWTSVITE